MSPDDEKRIAEIATRVAKRQELRSFLIEVHLRGYAEIKIRRLMSLLGKWHEKKERWCEIADAWVEDTGQPRSALKGLWWGDIVVLHTGESVGVASEWGQEKNLPTAA